MLRAHLELYRYVMGVGVHTRFLGGNENVLEKCTPIWYALIRYAIGTFGVRYVFGTHSVRIRYTFSTYRMLLVCVPNKCTEFAISDIADFLFLEIRKIAFFGVVRLFFSGQKSVQNSVRQ